jgi:hypothetical protein
LKEWCATIFAELASACHQLHRQVAEGQERREAERRRRNKIANVKQAHLSVGDYVLVGRVVGPIGNKGYDKLSETTHHVSRLKLFAGADMGVTQPLLDHIAYVEGGHLVEELLDYRYSRARKTWEIEVKWLGLQEIDNSWEPCDALLQDVPVLVREFIARGIKTSKNVAKMAIAYSLLPSSSDA